MSQSTNKKRALVALAITLAFVIMLSPAPSGDAADHGDAPAVANDQGADIADVYMFLDPNDNSRVILAGTVHGFIVPNEMVNFGIFDENVRYRFELEMTGDARPDRFVDVRFTRKFTSSSQAQIATVTLPSGQTFTAPTTVPTLNPDPPAPVVTTDSASGVLFYAGVNDDPFQFDITGFGRYAAPARNGTGPPDPTQFRGRDSFAGYNILGIAFSFPVALLRAAGANNEVGVNFICQRRSSQTVTKQGNIVSFGRWVTVDRMATPGVNVALTAFRRKDEFNIATPLDDQNGRFATDIIATLRSFRTDDTSIGILASIAIQRGDFIRLSLTTPNTGRQGGGFRSDTAGDRTPNDGAGFPNGRRLGDDVIDTELFLFNNRVPLSDGANSNELAFRNTFPFFAPPHQPFPPGVTDDRTRN